MEETFSCDGGDIVHVMEETLFMSIVHVMRRHVHVMEETLFM